MNLQVYVHIKSKMFLIPCGEGNQTIQWLGNVGILRYEHMYKQLNSTPSAMRFEDGKFLDLNLTIKDNIQNEQHVWFLLQEDKNEVQENNYQMDDQEFYEPEQTQQFSQIQQKNRPTTAFTIKQR